MKTASALLKNENVFVQAYAETTSGVWIAYGPVHVCPLDRTEDIADSVRRALELSTRGIAHPSREEWKDVQRPMLEAVGAKNWSALAKGAKAVGIEAHDSVVKFLPSLNYEDDGGSDLPDIAISSPLDDGDLGLKLIRAFEISS